MRFRLLAAVSLLIIIAALVPGQNRPRNFERSVAITFDDLPFANSTLDIAQQRELTTRLLKNLSANRVPAIGFVNENKLHKEGEEAARVALLQSWLDAGLELGNHTYSHEYFYKTALAEFEDNILRGETIT